MGVERKSKTKSPSPINCTSHSARAGLLKLSNAARYRRSSCFMATDSGRMAGLPLTSGSAPFMCRQWCASSRESRPLPSMKGWTKTKPKLTNAALISARTSSSPPPPATLRPVLVPPQAPLCPQRRADDGVLQSDQVAFRQRRAVTKMRHRLQKRLFLLRARHFVLYGIGVAGLAEVGPGHHPVHQRLVLRRRRPFAQRAQDGLALLLELVIAPNDWTELVGSDAVEIDPVLLAALPDLAGEVHLRIEEVDIVARRPGQRQIQLDAMDLFP